MDTVPPAQAAPPALALDEPPPPGRDAIRDKPSAQEIASVPGASEDWWTLVQEQIRLDQYSLIPDEEAADVYRAYNPDNGLALDFSTAGLHLAPVSQDGEAGVAWTWDMHLSGFGYQGAVQPVVEALGTNVQANLLEYLRPGLSEWYLNDERGLEQGFTIDAPPAPAGGESWLVLQLALMTDLEPILVEDSGVIDFTSPDSNVILLRYGGLRAYDAAGRELPSRLALSGCEGTAASKSCLLELYVDASAADYPLTVDPLIVSPDWSAVGENS